MKTPQKCIRGFNRHKVDGTFAKQIKNYFICGLIKKK